MHRHVYKWYNTHINRQGSMQKFIAIKITKSTYLYKCHEIAINQIIPG